METEVVYSNKKKTIQIHRLEDQEVLLMRFCGKLSHFDYMVGFEKLYHFHRVHEYDRIIIDYQQLAKVSVASRIWFLLHFAPKINQPSIQTAFVVYQNLATQIAVQTIQEELEARGHQFKMQQFESVPHAMNWLAA